MRIPSIEQPNVYGEVYVRQYSAEDPVVLSCAFAALVYPGLPWPSLQLNKLKG
jgi:hypothetical protein